MSLTKTTYSMIDGAIINVLDYGAKGDYNFSTGSGTDDTAAIQAAIDYAITVGGTVYLPSGGYKITSSLMVYRAGTFISCKFLGEYSSGLVNKGTVIWHTSMLTTPALMIQGARGVSVQGIQFYGSNEVPENVDWFYEAGFLVAGVRSTAYSPQGAICIDPFTSSVPSDGGYPGYTSYYNASALYSSEVVIRDCRFRAQMVAINYSPTGKAANNENSTVDTVTFKNCTTAIKLNQIQSKGLTFLNLYGDIVYTIIDAYTNATSGSAGFYWAGASFSRVNTIIQTLSQDPTAGGITQNWSIQGGYFEATYQIGYIGNGDGPTYVPGAFNSCTFWFSQVDNTKPINDSVLVNYAPLTFNNCNFINTGIVGVNTPELIKIYHESRTDQKNKLIFNNCKFQGYMPVFNTDYLDYIVMNNCTGGYGDSFRNSFSENYKIENLSSVTFYNRIWPGSLINCASPNTLFKIGQEMNAAVIGGSVAFTKASGASTATFTAPDPDILLVGDIIYTFTQDLQGISGVFGSGYWPLGIITSIVGSNVTIKNVSVNANSTSTALQVKWYPHMHNASTVATTNASTTIAITETGGGTNWQINQRIISTNIPSGAYIVSGTAPNFVISKAATATASGVRAYDANAQAITATNY